MEKITINNLEINVIRKRQKHVYLSVIPNTGKIRISVPKRTTDEYIKKLIMSKIEWIQKQQEKIKRNPIKAPKQYISGETHYYEGKQYILNVIQTKHNPCVKIDNEYINLYVKENSTIENRQAVLEKWYREDLRIKVNELIKKWTEIIQVKVNDFNIRKMKTRWGSCNIRTKYILINLELAKKKPQCLEYVVVHEIMHLLEKHHNSNFKMLMTKYLPNWKQCKKELNEMGME